MQFNEVKLGDCTYLMRKLPKEIFDLMIADPPYGLDFSGKEGYYGNRKGVNVIGGYIDVPAANYRLFSESWITKAARLLKPDGSCFIISGWTFLEHVLFGIRKAGLHLQNHLIWTFPFGVYAKNHYVTSHYHVLYCRKDPDRYKFNMLERYESDVWNYSRTNKDKGQEKINANALPLDMIERMILEASEPGDVVLDPFMGSGTTAIAALKNNRKFLGYEKNDETFLYCIDRIEHYSTGGNLFD